MAAVSGQAAAGHEAPAPAAAEDDPFAVLVHDAQASLTESIEKAGLGRDPYRFPMGALAQALGVLPAFMGRLDGVLDHARQPVDPVALERSMAQIVERVGRATTHSVNQHMLQMVRAHNFRTLLIYGGAFVGAVVAGIGGGFAWGQASANAAVHETEAQLVQAFQAGPGAAANWANLMRWNDINASLARCTGNMVSASGGRKSCLTPLWIEPASQAVPARYQ